MTKEELLQELAYKISSGEINKAEVSNRLGLTAATVSSGPESKDSNHFSVNKMLYVLGAAIVVIGVLIFGYQIWGDIGSYMRILITLGFGLLLTGIGSFLLKQKPDESIGLVFQAIGGLLVPGGALVTLNELSTGGYHPWVIAITFGAIFAFYLLLNFVHKNAVLTFFAIANGTAFVYLSVEAIVGGSFYMHGELYAYLTMVVGASYLLLAHAFQSGWNKQLIGVLYFFGSLAVLGAAFSRVFDSVPWQMFYFLLVIGGLYLAVYMRSRAVLTVSTIFLLVHVSYITGKYFANSIGWPVSLIVLGFIFIGLGYMSIRINKTYIQN